jgi:hypothetical protein
MDHPKEAKSYFRHASARPDPPEPEEANLGRRSDTPTEVLRSLFAFRGPDTNETAQIPSLAQALQIDERFLTARHPDNEMAEGRIVLSNAFP